MSGIVIPFPSEAERRLRRIMKALARKPDRAAAIARAFDRQAGRAPLGMFGSAS